METSDSAVFCFASIFFFLYTFRSMSATFRSYVILLLLHLLLLSTFYLCICPLCSPMIASTSFLILTRTPSVALVLSYSRARSVFFKIIIMAYILCILQVLTKITYKFNVY